MNDDVRPSDLRSLERRIATWMATEALDRDATAELDQILTATSLKRPEPRWLALLKEPPMRLSSPGAAVGLPARRLVLTFIVLALLAVGAAAAIVGSQLIKTSVIEPPVTSAPTATPQPPVGAQFVWRSTGPGQGFVPGSNMAFDPQGRIWTVDPPNDRFAIFTRDGTFVEYWGTAGTADGQLSLRRQDTGDGYGAVVFEPDGSFFVLDVGNGRVQLFDAARNFVRAWSTAGTSGQYSRLTAMAVSADGTLYIFDEVLGIIERRDQAGAFLASIPAYPNGGSGENTANGIAVDAAGNLYVSQIESRQVIKLDPLGNLLATFRSSTTVRFTDQPGQIAVDSAGRVFVTQGSSRGSQPGVLVFSADGQSLGGFGTVGPEDGQLYFPTGIILDGEGNLYVKDEGLIAGPQLVPGSIQKFVLSPPFID
jgi:DNA-binding beta-propeller fold protein YncE